MKITSYKICNAFFLIFKYDSTFVHMSDFTYNHSSRGGNPPSSTPTLEALENRVKMLEARIGNETISIGNFIFKSKEEVHEFIVNDFPSAS